MEVEVRRQADAWGCMSLHVCECFLEMLVGCAWFVWMLISPHVYYIQTDLPCAPLCKHTCGHHTLGIRVCNRLFLRLHMLSCARVCVVVTHVCVEL